MLDHLSRQYHDLVPILGIVAVLLMLTLGALSALGRKKSLAEKTVQSADKVFEVPAQIDEEFVAETLPESIVINKVTDQPQTQAFSYSMEEILPPPTEEELAIAEAIAEAGAAASSSETQQAQISFADEDKTSWRQAVRESLQRRMQRTAARQEAAVSQVDKMGVIVLYVMAPRSTQYKGPNLLNILKTEGLTLTDKRVFQMKDMDGTHFYVASAVNPGTFDLDFIHGFSTPGLSFILDLSAVRHPKQAFIKMLDKVGNVAERLGGDVLDEHRQRLTQAGINEYMVQIKGVENLRKRNDYA